MSPVDSTQRSPLAMRLILSLAVFALGLGALEWMARSRQVSAHEIGRVRSSSWKVCGEFDERFGWVNHPGAQASIDNGDFAYRARINSAGFRDPERAKRKPQATRRILLLGDSVAWGWGVDDGKRFSDLLEARLGPGVEVCNLAVPGYGTDQQYWTLAERGLAMQPDLVLLCFVINDVVEVETSEVYGMGKPRYLRDAAGDWRIVNQPVADVRGPLRRWGVRRWRELLASSAFLSEVGRANAGEVLASAPRKGPRKPPSKAFLDTLRRSAARIPDPASVTYMLLSKIDALCEQRGLPLLVFNVAHRHDQYLYEPQFPAPDIEDSARYQTVVTRQLARAGRRIGFETLSTDAAFLHAVEAGQPLHCGDGHPNERGHEVLADLLEPVLRARIRAMDLSR